MAQLLNETIIQGSINEIWQALSQIESLDKYDPTVKNSKALSPNKEGKEAKRKVTMKDGKNWFEEKCTVWEPEKTLKYELTACSFPVHQLNHSYSFEPQDDGNIKVKQVMNYRIKYGFFGKILDNLIVRKQSQKGIELFLQGLKNFIEKKGNSVQPTST